MLKGEWIDDRVFSFLPVFFAAVIATMAHKSMARPVRTRAGNSAVFSGLVFRLPLLAKVEEPLLVKLPWGAQVGLSLSFQL